jgi:DnaJ-class molecular chaperone
MTEKHTQIPTKPSCDKVICTKGEGFCDYMMFDAPCMCAEAYDELEELKKKDSMKQTRSEICRTCGGSGVSFSQRGLCSECHGKEITNWKRDGDPR